MDTQGRTKKVLAMLNRSSLSKNDSTFKALEALQSKLSCNNNNNDRVNSIHWIKWLTQIFVN